MKKYKISMNAGVEWWGSCESENLEQAREMAYELARNELGNLRDYNFDLEVEEE